ALKNLEGKATRENTPARWRSDGAPFIYNSLDDLEHLPYVTYNIDDFQLEGMTRNADSIISLIESVKGQGYMTKVGRDRIRDLNTIIMANVIGHVDPLSRLPVARGLYPSSSFVNHSCLSNSVWFYDSYGMLTYRSTRAIKAGEEITTTHVTLTSSKPKRINTLLMHRGYYCQCSRCSSDSSGNQCPKCREPFNHSQLKIWEPQPSIDFDGRAYQCSKGHVTMATLYDVIEDWSQPGEIIRAPENYEHYTRYFQKGNMVMLRHLQLRSIYLLEQPSTMPQVPKMIDQLFQCYDDAFGGKSKDVMPHHYVDDYQTLFLALRGMSKRDVKKLQQVKEQCQQMLEVIINLSTHVFRFEFECDFK
ncbi:hypothetical protein SAMD00019534_029590, partial [Acytostelium subglobosum LB1]|uniref:hypothetical protein n=1 Tax=Acytostelium subglobosum LB1 TaxID=1410327 RepID=UPI0006449618